MTTLDKPPAPTDTADEPRRPGPGRHVGVALERYGVLVAWAAVIAYFCIERPDTFASTATIKLILSTQTVVLLASLGLMITLAVGELDLSIGSVVGFGGALMAVLNGLHNLPWGLALFFTIVICMAFGVINAFLVVVVEVPSIIVTLGSGTFLAGLTLAISNSAVVTGISEPVITFITKPRLFGVPAPFYCAALLTIVLWFVLQHTPLGRRMTFVAENKDVARLAGVRVNTIRASAFVVTSTLGGIAGVVLAGTNGAANPQSGSYYLLPAFAAVFLGSTTIIPGRFNAIGTFVAVYFLVTGITGLQYMGHAGWPEQVFYGASLVPAVTLSRLVARRRMRKRT